MDSHDSHRADVRCAETQVALDMGRAALDWPSAAGWDFAAGTDVASKVRWTDHFHGNGMRYLFACLFSPIAASVIPETRFFLLYLLFLMICYYYITYSPRWQEE